MAQTRKRIIRKSKPPRRSGDMPATARMLHEARYELKSEITSFRLGVDSRFKSVDARFDEMDARFNKVDARLDDLGSKVESVLAAVHRVSLLVEEQNARNKYVLDGYASLSDRLDRVEKKVGIDL